jgi:hypothetical protein
MSKPEWTTDPSGLQHWRSDLPPSSTVYDAAARCLDTLNGRLFGRHMLRPAWFWWNDTPCPVVLVDGDVSNDTVSSLVDRWHEWRDHSKGALLAMLLVWSSPWSTRRVKQLPEGAQPKRFREHGRSNTLDADSVAAFDYGTERLWILPPGHWDVDFVVRSGIGMHTKLTAVSRQEASVWLERAALDPAKQLPEEPSTDS